MSFVKLMDTHLELCEDRIAFSEGNSLNNFILIKSGNQEYYKHKMWMSHLEIESVFMVFTFFI